MVPACIQAYLHLPSPSRIPSYLHTFIHPYTTYMRAYLHLSIHYTHSHTFIPPSTQVCRDDEFEHAHIHTLHTRIRRPRAPLFPGPGQHRQRAGAASDLARGYEPLGCRRRPGYGLLTSYLLHPTPCPLDPIPYTFSPYTLRPVYTLHPTPYLLCNTPYAVHPTPYLLYPRPQTPDPRP